MSNIEKIKAEIERLKVDYLYRGYTFVPTAMQQLLNFIDSLPEKPSEDLEEAAEEYADKHGFRVPYDGSNNYYDDVDVKASKEGFLAGAEWQKVQMMDEWLKDRDGCFWDGVNEGKKAMEEQMTKDAVEGEIGYWNQRGLSIRLDQSLEKLGYDEDIKVKIIIVKQ